MKGGSFLCRLVCCVLAFTLYLIGLLTFHWPIAYNLAYLLHDNIRQTFWLACLLTYFHNICWLYIRHFVFASSTASVQKESCRRQLSSQLPQAALYTAAVGSYLQLPQAALFSISPTWEYNHYCSMSMFSVTVCSGNSLSQSVMSHLRPKNALNQTYPPKTK